MVKCVSELLHVALYAIGYVVVVQYEDCLGHWCLCISSFSMVKRGMRDMRVEDLRTNNRVQNLQKQFANRIYFTNSTYV